MRFMTLLRRQPHPRVTLLATGGLIITVLLAACSGNPNAGANGNQSSTFVLDPTPNNIPAFPSVTLGAWIDNMTPVQGDNDTLYALVRAQPPDFKTAATPIPNVTVQTDTGLHGVTDADGLAAIQFQASAPPGQPLLIHVTASAKGVTVTTTTFYTTLSSKGATPTPKPHH